MRRRSWGVLIAAAATAVTLTGLITSSLSAQEVPAPAPSLLGSPPTTYRLTLEEAKERALTNNKQLQVGRLNVQEKQIAISAATRDYFPKVLGLASYLHFDEPLGTVVTTRGRRIGGRLPGPDITIPGQSVAVNVVNQDTAFGTLLVAQPITKLIGVSALVDLARADAGIAEAQLDKGTRDLLSGVAQAYYALHAARRIQAACPSRPACSKNCCR